MSAPPRIVLASGSPRRHALLSGYRLEIVVRPPDVDESIRSGEPPESYVARLAQAKVRAVRQSGEVAIAADTCVVVDGDVLGKPASRADARAMLERLAARAHLVISGVAVADDDGVSVETATTEVEMTTIGEAELEWYLGTDEPYDKAGAYAIQGLGGRFVRTVSGSPSNVIGLPLDLALDLLTSAGVDLVSPS